MLMVNDTHQSGFIYTLYMHSILTAVKLLE